jgi:pyrroline-5-carboxylate reductase
MKMQNYNVGIIGCGNMGAALVENLARALGPQRVTIFDKETSKTDSLSRGFKVNVAVSIEALVSSCDIIIIAVKPQDIESVLVFLKGRKDKLLVSIAAGVTIAYLAFRGGPDMPIVRAMPNLNALVAASTTGSAVNLFVTKAQKEIAQEIFRSIGSVVFIDEKLMNAFTAIAGSGPAFIAYVMDVLSPEDVKKVFVEEALAFGFDKDTSACMVSQTIQGTQKILKVNFDREVFIKKVCSKGGTTEAGIKVLEEKGKTAQALSAAVQAACRRAEELSRRA